MDAPKSDEIESVVYKDNLVSERRPRKKENFLTGDQFRQWMIDRNLTHDDVAEWWGVHRTTILYYCRNGVSKIHALAMAANERGLNPYIPTGVDE